MIGRVVDDLPAMTRIVFVVNRDHVESFDIDQVLTRRYPVAHIVVAPGLTQGQACSVQLGIPELNDEEDVLVAACDNTHMYNADALSRLCYQSTADAIIWTYRKEPRVLVNPHWYGWVGTDGSDRVTQVSVKRPISANLLQDHVISGAFWFRNAKVLADAVTHLIDTNTRVNNEFYLDSALGLMVQRGADVRVFEVDKYIGWGTPDDYRDYQLWSSYVRERCNANS